ncbi:tail fiber domain-containing protein [Escherichia coli]|uniref:tail fiber domain-containing protein n=1 Tax=Escherichia coli TaxID=562 RepID=UPI001FCEEEFF|nr:tail fiber domain-containing protein [Escherichia coli]
MIYTAGTIAISGNTVTGTGTNFTAPLSLIREGCTLIAVSDPVQIFTITEIKSGTELSVTPTADPAISAGTKFSILLSDSISVDGLAQDVAETLRYYQGKETEIANAVEFFQEFDLDGLIALVNQVHTDSAQVSADKATTQQYKTDVESAKAAAEAAAQTAEEGAVTATGAAVNAAESAANAEEYKNIAEGYKNDINPDSFLRIQNNLSDLADRAAAWLNVRPIGSTPLAGDPVSDYDAVTMRWVMNYINSGTVGPTMNGVMNYGVGDFHLRDSRAYIQPYEVTSDGQLLNRADWPELWAYAQMIGAIDDSEWLADKFQRGKYSKGDGATTFRVPDKNGIQEGSVRALYGRGDGGASSANGQVFESAAPNITGYFTTFSGGAYAQVVGASYGAFYSNNGVFPDGAGDAIPGGTTPIEGRYNTCNFDASRCSPIYGSSTDEILTRNFVGVWVIRASGGFTAANTSWSVINADKTRSSTGTKSTTGVVKSVYKIGDASECEVSMWGDAYIDQSHYAVIEVENKTSGNKGRITVNDGGLFESASFRATTQKLLGWGDIPTHGATFVVPFTNIGENWSFNSNFSAGQASSAGYATWYSLGLIHHDTTSFARTSLHCIGDSDNKYGVRLELAPLDSNIYFTKWDNYSVTETSTVTKNAISDIRFKHNVQHATVDKAWSNLENLDFVTFVFNGDEKERVRRGIISQSAELIDPLYVKTRTHYDNNNKEIEVKELDNTPLLLDTMHVTQSLMLKATTLEEENASLRANIAVMDERITKLEALVRQLTGSEE